MSDAPDNPQPFRLKEGDALGFSDDGAPVPVVWTPQFDESVESEDEERITLRDMPTLFLYGAKDAHEVEARVVFFGYLMKSEYAPRSYEELGIKLRCSKQAAHKRLTAFRRNCLKILTSGLTNRP